MSYFIEPNLGERGWGRRYRYASHGLRFEVKRPLENDNDFKRRINSTASALTTDNNWFLGQKNRNYGSIHSDVWHGSAADLATRGAIAIYPVGGWWKETKTLERWDETVRYSLIVSIKVPSVEVNIDTPVENLIRVSISIPVS